MGWFGIFTDLGADRIAKASACRYGVGGRGCFGRPGSSQGEENVHSFSHCQDDVFFFSVEKLKFRDPLVPTGV